MLLRFKYDFFFLIIDQTLNSNEYYLVLMVLFTKFKSFNINFDFILISNQSVKNMNNQDLMKNCKNLQNIIFGNERW